jgi:hypothetical protein
MAAREIERSISNHDWLKWFNYVYPENVKSIGVISEADLRRKKKYLNMGSFSALCLRFRAENLNIGKLVLKFSDVMHLNDVSSCKMEIVRSGRSNTELDVRGSVSLLYLSNLKENWKSCLTQHTIRVSAWCWCRFQKFLDWLKQSLQAFCWYRSI